MLEGVARLRDHALLGASSASLRPPVRPQRVPLGLGCEKEVAGDPGQGRDLMTAGFRAARRHHGAGIPCEQRGGVQDVVDGGDALVERGERGLLGHV